MEGKLTVYFDDPFWVGVFERCDGGKLSVCRVTFGAEPTDCEVYGFALRHWDGLTFSKAIEAEKRKTADNPKRRQRNARKQMAQKGIGTKSQQALQKQLEENKLERKVRTREEKQAEAKRLFELKQQKKKEKHKGR
ncbi:MAG: YjdF family protein [Ruminococcus sp.]|uniref:YjdF family protein n=1 Tax=Ruminococcus sp. TaxID=41978 RepID=UPI0025D9AD9F|nr:YjdF family protein [Ruminococcus sp.]MBO4867096.1 YjdF family protein [Ruminococcus sp.]